MKFLFSCCCLLLCFTCNAKDSFFPTDIFVYPASPSSGITPSLAETNRVKIIKALASPERDDLLRSIGVPFNILAESQAPEARETWFDLRGIEIRHGELLGNVNLSRLCLDNARFLGVDLAGTDFNLALLRDATFENVNLAGANFQNAHLEGCRFRDCNLQGAFFQQAVFDKNSRFVESLLDNALFDNTHSLYRLVFTGGRMQKAQLPNCSLFEAQFVNVDLSGANFSGSKLEGAVLLNCKIDGVDLTETDLSDARFDNVDLSTSLRLVRTKLDGTHLGNLDLSRIDISYVVWGDRDCIVGEDIEADQLAGSGMASADRVVRLYARAESIYRVLAGKYRQAGYLREYSKLHFRSCEVRLKLMRYDTKDGGNWEQLWLRLSRIINGYDTDLHRLILNFLGMIGAFWMIFLGGWIGFGRRWFRWYETCPDGDDFRVKEDGTYVEAPFLSPREIVKIPKNWSMLLTIPLEVSLGATFKFAEKLVNIPNILHLFRMREARPLPIGGAKLFFAIQAIGGFVLFFYAGRMLILLSSSF